MALITAQDYLYHALRQCGQLRPGYTSNSELLSDGLDRWRIMFDGFNAKRTMAYSIPDYIYPINYANSLNGIYGQGIQYTVGPAFSFSGTLTTGNAVVQASNTAGLIIGHPLAGVGIPAGAFVKSIAPNVSVTMSANATGVGPQTITVNPSFNGPRPEAIVRMNLYMTSVSPSQPTRIPLSPISAEEFSNISVLQLTPINVTTVFYYDPQFPQGVINVWPPLNGNSLEFFTWGFLTPPASLTQNYSAPPGYAEVIICELAKIMWGLATNDVFVNKVSLQELKASAAIAKKAVRDVNAPMPRMRNDFQSGPTGAPQSSWELLLTGIPY